MHTGSAGREDAAWVAARPQKDTEMEQKERGITSRKASG